uniref:Uncharacterized protein n=1 Tax=Molossus molossus TaxID=27622 RepID=A0A7J8BYC5_MOLMO|nr:hypothetical protein HJG59_010023 [Molossus molossus]
MASDATVLCPEQGRSFRSCAWGREQGLGRGEILPALTPGWRPATEPQDRPVPLTACLVCRKHGPVPGLATSPIRPQSAPEPDVTLFCSDKQAGVIHQGHLAPKSGDRGAPLKGQHKSRALK